ncbi:MAG TPA: glucose-6-phosphate dehydrogenase [Bryobacteraceae bacterium]|nr:glucose-6-phosphate dehydrogenase [Bryobacteraceae bacterium]
MAATEEILAANPFADALRFERRVPECAMVIFGANGDLTKRKLLPALYQLAHDRRLPAAFSIIGNSRTPMSDEAFREKMRESVKQFLDDGPFSDELWGRMAPNIHYVAGDMSDPAMYRAVAEKVVEIEQPNVLFYLSTQPSYYGPVVDGLGSASMGESRPGAFRRLVIEKPFGHDLESARALNARIHAVFEENEVYRIDHYLGKETVQNILAFRFGNGIFEPLWNRRYVNHVQITAAESIGVEGRGGYYQEAGALRDMIQNHLLQVMATVAMEPSAVFEPDAVRDERAKLLRSVKIVTPEEVPQYAVAGQYRGFRDEPGVRPDSQTETFAAATFFVDNWRWAGVPFFIRTGKKLPKRATEIAIQFNMPPLSLFTAHATSEPQPSLLILRIQPEEGISLRFQSKQPGSGMRLRPVSMDFNYGASFGERSPSAYETLLVDALTGDATLYTRQDMVEASWKVVEPILNDWAARQQEFPNYDPGTWGPAKADHMLLRLGYRWRNS